MGPFGVGTNSPPHRTHFTLSQSMRCHSVGERLAPQCGQRITSEGLIFAISSLPRRGMFRFYDTEMRRITPLATFVAAGFSMFTLQLLIQIYFRIYKVIKLRACGPPFPRHFYPVPSTCVLWLVDRPPTETDVEARVKFPWGNVVRSFAYYSPC